MLTHWNYVFLALNNRYQATSALNLQRIQWILHYDDVIMTAMASQIKCLTIVFSTVYSGADQRKHQSSASLAFVRGIHRWPVNSPHKGPVTKCFHLMTSSWHGLCFVVFCCIVRYQLMIVGIPFRHTPHEYPISNEVIQNNICYRII